MDYAFLNNYISKMPGLVLESLKQKLEEIIFYKDQSFYEIDMLSNFLKDIYEKFKTFDMESFKISETF